MSVRPPARGSALSHLGRGGSEVAGVALRAHPALGAVRPPQVLGREDEELVRGAGRAAHAHTVLSTGHLPDAADAAVRDANTIAHAPCPGHLMPSSSRAIRAHSALRVAAARAPGAARIWL